MATHRDDIARMLDYHLRLDSASERLETQQLLVEDRELQRLSDQVEQMLRPLAAWADAEPPTGLSDRVLKRVRTARQAREALNLPVARQQWPIVRSDGRAGWLFNNLRDLMLVAASVLFVFMLSRPAMMRMREVAQQNACALQMRQIHTGVTQYAGDHGSKLPFLPRPENASWWSVQPDEAQSGSNTRNLFVLVRNGYLPVKVFSCPGRRDEAQSRCRTVELSPETLGAMHDFANRAQVHFSLRISGQQNSPGLADLSGRVLLADQNPLFVDFDPSVQSRLDLSGCGDLLERNSPNHGERGQNLLYGDGSVRFVSERWVGPSRDDVFTIENQTVYYGNETPERPDDTFIAP